MKGVRKSPHASMNENRATAPTPGAASGSTMRMRAAQAAAAVDPGCLLQLAWDRIEEPLHQPQGEWQLLRGEDRG